MQKFSLTLFVSVVLLLGRAGAGNTTGAPDFWVGSGEGRRAGGDRWANVEFSYRTSFLFTVDSSGRAAGDAVAIYDLRFDDGPLRSYLGLLHNTVTAGTIGLLPAVAGLLGPGASTKDILGLRMSYDEPAPVRRGKISGSLHSGTLHLDWTVLPKSVSYTWFRVYTTKEEKFKSGAASPFRPWSHDGHVIDSEGLAYAVSIGDQKMGSTTEGGYWIAHRVR